MLLWLIVRIRIDLKMLKALSILIITSVAFFNKGCYDTDGQQSEQKSTNHLADESSPYLLQHANNPVDWYSWNDDPFEKAKKEDKLVIISVGYTACHWCHVMERKSFMDTAVANLMNEHFVSVKVDREQRPDVDQVYMDAAYATTGRGGWPLNAIALPNGKPLFAGTYFPKAQWIKLLEQVSKRYNDNPEQAKKQANQLTQNLKQAGFMPKSDPDLNLDHAYLDSCFNQWKTEIDFNKGGYQGSPKFPKPNSFNFLLQYHHVTGNKKALKAINTTLHQIALGGIYDQIGGGFARYSTDKNWHVPHFEKMLYDNAQLVSLYSKAYQLTSNPFYKKIVEQTLDFIERSMTAENGGFYSSLAAVSDGVEGKYYVWTPDQIDSILERHSDLVKKYYNVTQQGNWENGKNVLDPSQTDSVFAKNQSIELNEWLSIKKQASKQLLKARQSRTQPPLDDKILTSWNALMLRGYVDAYRAIGHEQYLAKAIENANFIVQNAMHANGRLTRNYKDGKATVSGFLDDYSFTIEAFIALYQASFDEHWLKKAKKLAAYGMENFYDPETGLFHYKSKKTASLYVNKKELRDKVIPSSNSSMAKGIFQLGHYYYKEHQGYVDTAAQMVATMKSRIDEQPSYYSNWLKVALNFIDQPYEVAVLGADWKERRKRIDRYYLPQVMLMGGKQEGNLPLLQNKLKKGQTTIYVCQNKVCKLPVTSVEKALDQLKQGI